MNKIVERIWRTQVTTDDLRMGLEALNDLPQEDRRDLTARALCLFRVFDGEPDLASKTAAVDWRFEALARLSHRPELRAWSIPPDHMGKMMISETVLEAAAAEPLISVDDRPAFDPECFFKRLLALSGTDGTG